MQGSFSLSFLFASLRGLYAKSKTEVYDNNSLNMYLGGKGGKTASQCAAQAGLKLTM
jgi:hypothetical protein